MWWKKTNSIINKKFFLLKFYNISCLLKFFWKRLICWGWGIARVYPSSQPLRDDREFFSAPPLISYFHRQFNLSITMLYTTLTEILPSTLYTIQTEISSSFGSVYPKFLKAPKISEICVILNTSFFPKPKILNFGRNKNAMEYLIGSYLSSIYRLIFPPRLNFHFFI